MLLKIVILWISCFVAGSSAAVASFIKPCSALDSDCILNSATIALPYFAKGVPEIGIPSIEPLALNEIVADSGDLKLTFKNVLVHNLSQCKIISIVRDPVKQTGNLVADCPLVINGDYILNGKLFVVEVHGNDVFEIGGGRIKVFVDFKLKEVNGADGKKHYKIKTFNYKYEPIAKFHFKFVNLYNGDQEKAKPIEQILDQSWKELILDLGQPVIKTAVTKLVSIIGKLFHAAPIDELELPL